MCVSGSKRAESDEAHAPNDPDHPPGILLAANACKFRAVLTALTLMAYVIITLWILTPAQLPCLIKGDKVVTLWAIPTLTPGSLLPSTCATSRLIGNSIAPLMT